MDKILMLFGSQPLGLLNLAGAVGRTSVHACRLCGALVVADDMEKHLVFHEGLGLTILLPEGKEWRTR